MHKILIVGGGISGVEAALTLSKGLPDSEITLLSPSKSLKILPNLVYTAFGISQKFLDIPLPDLPFNVIQDRAIKMDSKTVTGEKSVYDYDSVILALGIEPTEGETFRLRTLDDAESLHLALQEGVQDDKLSVALRILPDLLWPGPAYEFSLLLSHWLKEIHPTATRGIFIVTEDHEAFNFFNHETSQMIAKKLKDHGIDLVYGVPPGRLENLHGDIDIDFDKFRARHLPGSPALNSMGFYDLDDQGLAGENIYVVGDGANLPIKAAFTSSWQARRVLYQLGGSLDMESIGGVPVGFCEYQMDMGHSTMVVKFDADKYFLGHHLVDDIEVEIVNEPTDKLKGTFIYEELLQGQVSYSYRQMLEINNLKKLYARINPA